jgi:hypothetical protein
MHSTQPEVFLPSFELTRDYTAVEFGETRLIVNPGETSTTAATFTELDVTCGLLYGSPRFTTDLAAAYSEGEVVGNIVADIPIPRKEVSACHTPPSP